MGGNVHAHLDSLLRSSTPHAQSGRALTCTRWRCVLVTPKAGEVALGCGSAATSATPVALGLLTSRANIDA